MALTEFSTQVSVEARASSARVKLWTDRNKDGAPDPATLTQGFQFASGIIAEYVVARYGETEFESWTIDTAPDRVLSISDDLSMWYFASGLNSLNTLIETIYQQAIDSLAAIRDKESYLYGATEGVTLTSDTEEPENPFDERTYFNG